MPANKPSVNFMDVVVNRSLAGISEAQKHYDYWTGGYSLWQAPEYMLTTYIARHISAIDVSPFYLTLENNVEDGINEAGGLGRGKLREDLRPGGRFDILIWWGNGTPRAILEVKNRVIGFSNIQDDVSRICATLSRSNTIRCGFIAYYSSHSKPNSKRKSAKDRVIERVDEVASKAKVFTNQKGRKFNRYPAEVNVNVVGNGRYAWTAEVLKISR